MRQTTVLRSGLIEIVFRAIAKRHNYQINRTKAALLNNPGLLRKYPNDRRFTRFYKTQGTFDDIIVYTTKAEGERVLKNLIRSRISKFDSLKELMRYLYDGEYKTYIQAVETYLDYASYLPVRIDPNEPLINYVSDEV